MKSTYTIAVNEVIGLSTAETILMQFEYDQQKINDPETTLRTAIKNYMKTDTGKQQVNMNCGCFNWGDAYDIPDRCKTAMIFISSIWHLQKILHLMIVYQEIYFEHTHSSGCR